MEPLELEARLDLLKERLSSVNSTVERQLWEDAYEKCLSIYKPESVTKKYHEAWFTNYKKQQA